MKTAMRNALFLTGGVALAVAATLSFFANEKSSQRAFAHVALLDNGVTPLKLAPGTYGATPHSLIAVVPHVDEHAARIEHFRNDVTTQRSPFAYAPPLTLEPKSPHLPDR
jgi:hypothetical protein